MEIFTSFTIIRFKFWSEISKKIGDIDSALTLYGNKIYRPELYHWKDRGDAVLLAVFRFILIELNSSCGRFEIDSIRCRIRDGRQLLLQRRVIEVGRDVSTSDTTPWWSTREVTKKIFKDNTLSSDTHFVKRVMEREMLRVTCVVMQAWLYCVY